MSAAVRYVIVHWYFNFSLLYHDVSQSLVSVTVLSLTFDSFKGKCV